MHPTPSTPVSNPAQMYEDYFVTNQFRPWTGELLDRAKPRSGERILDVACGTGIVARLVARQLNGQAQVVGLDPSPAMLEVARATAAREGVAIEWHEGKAEALPFPEGSFDLVLIQQGLQYFQDKIAGLREIHRVLAPGGRVASVTWAEIEHSPFNEAFAEVILRHLGTPAMHTPFALGNQDTLRALFVDAGFDAIEIAVVDRPVRLPQPGRFVEIGIEGASAAVPDLQKLDAAERAALTKAIGEDMGPVLQQYVSEDAIVAPLRGHVVVAYKAGPEIQA